MWSETNLAGAPGPSWLRDAAVYKQTAPADEPMSNKVVTGSSSIGADSAPCRWLFCKRPSPCISHHHQNLTIFWSRPPGGWTSDHLAVSQRWWGLLQSGDLDHEKWPATQKQDSSCQDTHRQLATTTTRSAENLPTFLCRFLNDSHCLSVKPKIRQKPAPPLFCTRPRWKQSRDISKKTLVFVRAREKEQSKEQSMEDFHLTGTSIYKQTKRLLAVFWCCQMKIIPTLLEIGTTISGGRVSCPMTERLAAQSIHPSVSLAKQLNHCFIVYTM